MEATDLTLRKTITVARPPEVAFRVFTEGLTSWWPARTHSVGHERVDTIVLEGHVGGRFYERLDDGTEHEWGEVTAWEPPHRLGYVWHLRTNRASATDVEIRFAAVDDGTRVEIEHAGWERLGDAAEAWRDRNHAGWTTLLPHFLAATTAS